MKFADRQFGVGQPRDIVDQFVDLLPVGLGSMKFT